MPKLTPNLYCQTRIAKLILLNSYCWTHVANWTYIADWTCITELMFIAELTKLALSNSHCQTYAKLMINLHCWTYIAELILLNLLNSHWTHTKFVLLNLYYQTHIAKLILPDSHWQTHIAKCITKPLIKTSPIQQSARLNVPGSLLILPHLLIYYQCSFIE